MADRGQQQMVQSALVLQLEATAGLMREFYQQTEAFAALAQQHPLTKEPLSTAAASNNSTGVALRSVAPLGGSAGLVSDAVARLSRDVCDAHACVRSAEHLDEFLKRLPDTAKTDDDRVQLLYILDLTLQRARKGRSGAESADADAGRAITSHFEQMQGYSTITEWFAHACTYHDEPRRRLAQLALRVLLRNKPKLQFARGVVIQKLIRTLPYVADKPTKELLQQVLEKYREGSVLHKRQWKRRYFRLDVAFGALETFSDEAMHERKTRIGLRGAQVATTDKLGGLLFAADGKGAQLSAKISLENSRRFVIRVSELDATKKARTHHFLCAEVVDNAGAVNAQASRTHLQQWLRALQQAAYDGSAAAALHSLDAAHYPLDSRELSNSIAAFMDQIHVSARVTGREIVDKKSVFELTVKAWILRRELVAADGGADDDAASSWQVLEYACAWKTHKSSVQLRGFDAQLRQFFRQELRDVSAPPSGSALSPAGAIHHLLHSAAHAEAETRRRVSAMDAYLQQLLCLPALSAFGGDGSAMLDVFLDLTPHFVSFRQLEKASGQSMHLRQRKVVPWSERDKFERLYRMHVGAAEPLEPRTSVSALRDLDTVARRRSSKHQHRRHHERHEHHHRSSSKTHAKDRDWEAAIAQASDEPAVPASDSVRAASIVEVQVLLHLRSFYSLTLTTAPADLLADLVSGRAGECARAHREDRQEAHIGGVFNAAVALGAARCSALRPLRPSSSSEKRHSTVPFSPQSQPVLNQFPKY
ncbi:hypothetical protein PybrP1_012890 [[Pythium] brassicae (nom. inval.)]|nr:hypothetical protein PybrP1_012890 [[Pythium] brassicae (nom. inval.)]